MPLAWLLWFIILFLYKISHLVSVWLILWMKWPWANPDISSSYTQTLSIHVCGVSSQGQCRAQEKGVTWEVWGLLSRDSHHRLPPVDNRSQGAWVSVFCPLSHHQTCRLPLCKWDQGDDWLAYKTLSSLIKVSWPAIHVRPTLDTNLS